MPVSMAGHARLALTLLDHLGEGQADVLGLSFGGLVAQELARLAPTRVERVVLSSTSCGWGGIPGTPAALMAVMTPQRYYSPDVFRAVAPQYIGGVESESRDFLRRQVRIRQSNPPSATGYLHQVWAAATWSSLCWLPEVRQPTLVVAGECDPLVPPANADLLAALLPSARTHIVPGGGHLCLLDRAEELAPMIEGFLSRPDL
jgi:pimeloyl-ACP methyl ester carboxylesterase